MSRVQIRNLRDIVDVEKTFGESKAIFEGTYGCTFNTVQILDDDGDAEMNEIEKRAVKIQGYNNNDTERAQAITEEAVLGLTLSDITKKTTPGVIKIFDNFKSTQVPVEWLPSAKQKCPNFYEFANNTQNKQKMFWYLIMEYGDAGDLQNYIEIADNITDGIKSKEIQSFVFQLIWTIHCLQTQVGFRHFDLKPENIILKSALDGEVHEFKRKKKLGSEQWTLFIGPKNINRNFNSSKYVLKVIDFGLSKVAKTNMKTTDLSITSGAYVENAGGTPPYMDPKTLFEYLDIKNQFKRGYDVDMWAIGMIIIDLCLSGWKRPTTLNHGYWPRLDTYTSNITTPLLFHFGSSEDVFKMVAISIKPELGEEFNPNEEIDTSINDLIIGMCLLNDALGNGILPDKEAWPRLVESDYYRKLRYVRSKLEKLSNMKFGGKRLYMYIVDRIKDKIGEDGLELVKGLLSWSPDVRVRLGKNRKYAKYLYGALEMKYFDSLKINLKKLLKNQNNETIKDDTELYTWELETSIDPVPLEKQSTVKTISDIRYGVKGEAYDFVKNKVKKASNEIVENKQKIIRRLRNGKIMYEHDKMSIGKQICFGCYKDKPTNLCGNCKRIAYCSETCQYKHWPIHQKQCLN